MKKMRSTCFWLVILISSCYCFLSIYFGFTNTGSGAFPISYQRIMLFFPCISLIFSSIMLVWCLFLNNSYQRIVDIVHAKFSAHSQILIGIFFWFSVLLAGLLVFYQLISKLHYDAASYGFGIYGIHVFSYGDWFWGLLFLIFIWSTALFISSYLNRNNKHKLSYYVFFAESKREVVLLIGFISFVVINIYNLFWLKVITDHSFGSDFQIYFNAFIKAVNGENPYVPYNIGTGYINHPFLLSLISLLPNNHDGSLHAKIVWAIFSFIAWMGTLKINLKVVSDKRIKIFLFFLLLLTFGPLYEMLFIGQVNAFVIFAISLFFHYRKKEWLMGSFLAIAIVLKTSPVIFIAYLLITKKWKGILSCSLTVILLTIISMIQFHPSIIFQFISAILQVGFELITGKYNESLVRLLYQFLNFLHLGLNTENITHLVTSGLMIGVTGALCLIHFLKSDKNYEYLLFICFNMVMVVFSPLVWYHHFVFYIIPLIGLYKYPISEHKKGLLLGLALILIQLQRISEMIWKPGFPVFVVSFFMIVYFLTLYFSNNKLRWIDVREVLITKKAE